MILSQGKVSENSGIFISVLRVGTLIYIILIIYIKVCTVSKSTLNMESISKMSLETKLLGKGLKIAIRP